MADVFLSYAKQDFEAASYVVQALERAGYSVFWRKDVPVERNWNSWIGSQLLSAEVCVVLWSKQSAQCRGVAYEVDVALRKDKLISATIEDPADLPKAEMKHAIDLRDFKGAESAGVADLIAAVRNVAGDRAPRLIPVSAPLIRSRPPAYLPQPANANTEVLTPVPGRNQHKIVRKELRTLARNRPLQQRPRARAAVGNLAFTALAGCLAGYILMSEPSAQTDDSAFAVKNAELAANASAAIMR